MRSVDFVAKERARRKAKSIADILCMLLGSKTAVRFLGGGK